MIDRCCTDEEFIKYLRNGIFNQDRVALARTISLVENEEPAVVKLLMQLHRSSGRAFRVGITGPPGAGKSTLVDGLAREFRKRGDSVGIIAVDPTSPFSGGALLGDRIRMSKALADPDIFMRSMASRGGTGGLARTTFHAIDVLDAFGFDTIITETVGVGQLELDIADSVDATVVVLVPETGGNVQAMKAGLIEIADIFVINKADREGSDILKMELRESLDLRPREERTRDVPIVKTCAVEGKGVSELAGILKDTHLLLREQGLLKNTRLRQKKNRITAIIRQYFENLLWNNASLIPVLDNLAQKCVTGDLDPYTAAESFLKASGIFGERDLSGTLGNG